MISETVRSLHRVTGEIHYVLHIWMEYADSNEDTSDNRFFLPVTDKNGEVDYIEMSMTNFTDSFSSIYG